MRRLQDAADIKTLSNGEQVYFKNVVDLVTQRELNPLWQTGR
jgi:hypothetical protein